jgi:N-acetyltransferase 10
MCILQDFEAITPNLLARTIETVEGGGLIILMLKTMSSLKQLYTMTMVRFSDPVSLPDSPLEKDVHSRYRSSSGSSVVARFNERFILSLGSCNDCLVLDDELNVLPISRGKDITPLDDDALEKSNNKAGNQELASLRESFDQNKLQGPLVKLAKTIDQVRFLPQPPQ